MLLKETMEITRKLLEEAKVDCTIISEADILVHINEKKPEESPVEYNLTVKGLVRHWQIQKIDEILEDFDNVEMQVTSEGLEIFEKEA